MLHHIKIYTKQIFTTIIVLASILTTLSAITQLTQSNNNIKANAAAN